METTPTQTAVPENLNVPEAFRADIQRAIHILKEAGCTEIYLFGSLARGEAREDSDIDLAVRGCPKKAMFHLRGRLLLELEHLVDLVRLDPSDRFAVFLQKTEKLVPLV